MAKLRNALVTGASSGIGRAISIELAKRGTRVVLAARRLEELGAVRNVIVGAGGVADVQELDVCDVKAIESAVSRWDRELGGLDLVLANAGINSPLPISELDWEPVERVFRVNTLGALATLVAAKGPMLARGRGTLAAVTSLAGMRGMAGHAAYCASKAAVSTFLEAIRAELAPAGVRVVDVRPGFVDTPLTRQNRFQMPFMWSAERAAELTVGALERGTPVVAFPWQLSGAMSVAERLPDVVWRALAARLPR